MVWGDLTCKECGNKGLLFREKYEYCPHCKKKYSVKADASLFKFCNLSFRQIYALIWCQQHKCSIGEIKNILGLSYPTVSIKSGSLVLTDGFKGYNELPILGYKWEACDHSTGFFDPTNHIESLWSVIKRALRYIYRDLIFNLKDLESILKEYENKRI